MSRLSSISSLVSSLSLFKFSDRVEHFVRGFGEGERPELSRKGVVGWVKQGVELGGEEPGEGGEHKVEHVLPDVDHDVVVLPKPFGNRVPVLIDEST